MIVEIVETTQWMFYRHKSKLWKKASDLMRINYDNNGAPLTVNALKALRQIYVKTHDAKMYIYKGLNRP